MTASSGNAELFPLFLKLEGRTCLVVGAGRIAEAKIESLLRCAAQVRVVAPAATGAIRRAARAGRIEWRRRPYRSSDLSGMFLVVAATSSPVLHERIFRQAHRKGVLCNAVDEPARCDFYYPAVVRRGPLQIAVSTSGCSPSLAHRLRTRLESQFPPEYGPWTEQLGRARAALLARKGPSARRRGLMEERSSDQAFRKFRRRAVASAAGKDSR